MYHKSQDGALLILVIIFGSVLFIIISSFMGFVIAQNRLQEHKLQGEKALALAESGLNYYKWYLAHHPDDLTHGTGAPGPYQVPYTDFETGLVGTSTIAISSTSYCGVRSSIDIVSTGSTAANPNVSRSVSARYTQPSVAEYVSIINSDVFVGADQVITGPYHANGGIRMDGSNNSVVTSGVATWSCNAGLGCSPTNNTANGVLGNGPNSDLWQWPVPAIDFSRLGIDVLAMKSIVQNNAGSYIAPSGASGYRVQFVSDGSYDLYRVRNRENEPQGNAYGYHLNKIKNAQYIGNYPINPDCPVIFVEDDVWIGGNVFGKVTIVAASNDTGIDRSMFIQDNITYADDDTGLLAIAEKDLLIGFDVPEDMEINGIFVAQNGHFGRNDYSWFNSPASWQQYVQLNSLTIRGTIVSNGGVGTKWLNGSGTFVSGFDTRTSSYDRRLVTDPPPLTPKVSDNYTFIEWRQN